MKKGIKKFKEETGYLLTEKDNGFCYDSSLDLEETGITSLPDNLTVGGSLYLGDTGITSLPDNLTVGGSLYLEETGVTSLPDNLTVGGSLYLKGTGITDTSVVNRNVPDVFFWKNRTYIKADGVFSKVLSHKGNVFRIQQIGCDDISYLITDGNGKWSHGENLKEAKEDLIYKISNRDKSEYEYLTIESEVSFEKAIEIYRVITGACSFGTKDFVNNRLNKKKSKYTIAEIIELTKGEYGNSSLISFFSMKKTKQQIESQAKKIIENANKLPPEANYFGSVDHIKIGARTIIELLNKEKRE